MWKAVKKPCRPSCIMLTVSGIKIVKVKIANRPNGVNKRLFVGPRFIIPSIYGYKRIRNRFL